MHVLVIENAAGSLCTVGELPISIPSRQIPQQLDEKLSHLLLHSALASSRLCAVGQLVT